MPFASQQGGGQASNPGGNAKPERFVVEVSAIDRFTELQVCKELLCTSTLS